MMTVRDRLRTDRNVWLATTRQTGKPHLTPIWFVYLDDRFWIGTGADNVKTRNVSLDDRVALALEDGDAPVVVEGSVVVHASMRPSGVVDAFAEKYGWNIEIREDADVGTVVLWEITPEKWLFVGPE